MTQKDWPGKLIMIFVVLLAFVDGILVAEKLDGPRTTKAGEAALLEEVFNLPSQSEPEEKETEAIPVQVESTTLDPLPPFISQAPYGVWTKPWAYYAEEAVLLMAAKAEQNLPMGDREETAAELLAIGEWERTAFGHSKDTSLEENLRILKEFFKINSAEIMENPALPELLDALDENQVLLVPVNGKILANPHYGDPAPEHHMILIWSYDSAAQEFIAHDPGTRYGEGTRYSYEKILNAIQDMDGQARALSL